MNTQEKEHLQDRIQTLIHEVAYTGGWEYKGDCGEYKLTPYLSTQCSELEMVIYHLVNALGSLESIETEDYSAFQYTLTEPTKPDTTKKAEHAKAAAEAECDRLNEQYRKETK